MNETESIIQPWIELMEPKKYPENAGNVFRERSQEFRAETNDECFSMGLLKLAKAGIIATK